MGTDRFWTTGAPDKSRAVIATLWGGDVDVATMPAR
jgi:hypothetical protein